MVRRLSFAAAFLTVSLAGSLAFAQAALEVAVFAPGSKPAAGLEVRVDNGEITFTAKAVTDAMGKVRFAPLSTAGHYTVRVAEGPEYFEAKAEGLTLRSNFDRSLSLTLTPRARGTESVTVTALPSIGEMNGTNAEVASTLDTRELETLAVEGRDTTRALYRLPNVTQATGFYPEAPNVSINGTNGLYANYVVDGLDNNENFLGGQKFAMPVGFTQQVTVLTSNYSTEFGRTGNGIFNLTSRSGGNLLRGEVFYLSRPGPSVDASSPFLQRDLSGNAVKDGFQRNQGGFVLGGPIVRDQTFFLVNAEYTRDRKDNILSSPALGVAETVRGHNDFLYLSGKVDQRWNDRWTSSVRLNVGRTTIERQGGGLDGGVTFPSAGNFQDRDSVLAAAKTYYATSAFVSETAVQYSRFRWNYGRAQNEGSPQTVVLGPSGETLAVLGNPGYVFDDVENTFQVQEKLSFQKGRHRFKVGADLISADFALSGGGNAAGNYTVALTDAQLAAVRASGKGTALDVRDIPADATVLDCSVELQPKAFGTRQNLLGLYAEDLFAATSRLNLTLGLRYDYDSLSKGGSSSGDKNNLAVRTAFNYDLDGKSVVRGGYGIFYDKILYTIYSDALQQNSTAAGYRGQLLDLQVRGLLPADTDFDRITFDGNLTANFAGGPYLGGPTSADAQAQRDRVTSSERRILNPNGYPNPLTHQLSLGYQRQLGRRHLVSLDLIHSRANGLPRLRDLNAPAPYPVDPNDVVVRSEAEANATRPIALVPGGARSVIVTETEGKGRYYAATATLVKDRGDAPYSYRLSYTLSRFQDDTDDVNFRAQDANDFAAEYGPSVNDRRHVINAMAWVHPTKSLSLSLAGLVQSGQPVNRIPDARIFGTTDLNGDGRSFGDAYVGNSDRWPGASRNGDRLPWSYVFDLAAQYGIRLGSSQRLELRADVFNLFNHPNLSGYSNNATQSNQIQIGPPGAPIVEKNAGPPRQFQFGVRFVF
jgi:TonB-dependent Receptor Plug Domain/TonB dependent receptor